MGIVRTSFILGLNRATIQHRAVNVSERDIIHTCRAHHLTINVSSLDCSDFLESLLGHVMANCPAAGCIIV